MRATMEGSEAERKVPKGLEDQAESDRSGASDTRLRSVTARSAERWSAEGLTTDRSEKRRAATPTRAFCAVGGVRSRGVQTIAQRDNAAQRCPAVPPSGIFLPSSP